MSNRVFASPPNPTDPRKALGPGLEFMRLLWAIDHGLQRMSHRMERTVGVTGPQRLVLRIVGRRPGISPTVLAQTMHLHPGTLTGVLQRLVAKGLLERTVHPHDGRRSLLRLTDAGEVIERQRAWTAEDRVQAALRLVPEAHVELVRRVLSLIADALDPE